MVGELSARSSSIDSAAKGARPAFCVLELALWVREVGSDLHRRPADTDSDSVPNAMPRSRFY